MKKRNVSEEKVKIYQKINGSFIDISVFLIANLINFLLIGIFISRSKGLNQLESVLGVISIAMIFPLSIIMILNLLARKAWWFSILLIPIILFLIFNIGLSF